MLLALLNKRRTISSQVSPASMAHRDHARTIDQRSALNTQLRTNPNEIVVTRFNGSLH